MAISEIAIAEKLSQFTREYADSHCCLELLRFFGAYPHARFNKLAVIHALDVNGRKLSMEKALKHLIDKGIVKTYIENSVRLYSLTEDGSLRSLALDLAKLDWPQWQLVVRQIHSAPTE